MSLIETISTLAQAGFTKDDILRFAGMQPTTPVAPQAGLTSLLLDPRISLKPE